MIILKIVGVIGAVILVGIGGALLFLRVVVDTDHNGNEIEK